MRFPLAAIFFFFLSVSVTPQTVDPSGSSTDLLDSDGDFPVFSPLNGAHEPAGKAVIGINLGNTLDAVPNEGSWTAGVKAREQYFDDYVQMGFNLVRIPVTWSSHTDKVPPYSIDPVFLARVKEVVNWSLRRNLITVLNCHHEDWLFQDYGKGIDRLDSIWTQVSTAFMDADDHLIFEIMNEPFGKITDGQVNDMNQRELNIIRITNPTRRVIVGPNQYNDLEKLPALVLPTTAGVQDKCLIATFHYYKPWDFAGKAEGTWGSAQDKATLKQDFTKVQLWSQTHGSIPVFIGEYGVAQEVNGIKPDIDSRARWYRAVSELARKYAFWTAAWDDYGAFGLFSRMDDTFEAGMLMNIFGDTTK